jgi:hypothetical protein
MTSFANWLERRDPVQRWAQQYAALQSDPVALRRVQREMEAEADSLRQRLGLKRSRRTKTRPGL